MTMKNRLLEFIKSKDISNRRFLLKCGLSETYINTLTGNPSGDTIAKIEEAYPDLNIQWLKTGEGEMLKVPAVLTVYNPTAEDAKAVEAGMELSMYPAEVVEEVRAEVISEAVVPIVPKEIAQKANTNIRKYIEENASELEHFDPLAITAEVDGAERICTTSMATTFVPGDVVFVRFLKDKTQIVDGAMYYFDLKTKPTMIRMVKIVDNDRLLLRALNPRYGDLYISKDEINNIGELKGMYRATFSDLSAEIEEVRRKKDEQVDKLIAQNGEALRSICELVSVIKNK